MLIVLNRYRIILAILLLIILAAVIWLVVSARSSKIPSKGIFVTNMKEHSTSRGSPVIEGTKVTEGIEGSDSLCSRL
jgi:high-affinity Fe2+/Pb2+ permease